MRMTAPARVAVVWLATGAILASFLTLASDEEIVAFNEKSLKYHCTTCEWARKCTANCVMVKKSEAIRRGGVPGKVCNGTCR